MFHSTISRLTFKNGTATSGVDFSDEEKLVLIQTSTQQFSCADIEILQDNNYEGNENFTIVLMLYNNSNVQITVGEATVTIIDDEGISFRRRCLYVILYFNLSICMQFLILKTSVLYLYNSYHHLTLIYVMKKVGIEKDQHKCGN